jgi:hypothetical protein
MLVQWLDQCNIPQVTKYCYSDTYESLTHNTKITYLLVLMQLHLNPSFKGNKWEIFVTQCVSDLIRYIRVPVNWETKRNETKTKFNEICKVRKRNPTKRNDEICKVRKKNITKRNEIYKVSSNNKTLNTRKGYNGMPLHVMEQPPRFFALAYRVSDACIYQ